MTKRKQRKLMLKQMAYLQNEIKACENAQVALKNQLDGVNNNLENLLQANKNHLLPEQEFNDKKALLINSLQAISKDNQTIYDKKLSLQKQLALLLLEIFKKR